MNITIGQHTFTADFAETAATAELQKRLPLTLTMQDLHRNEKYATLPQALPAADEAVEHIEAGDILLWQGDTVVIFYESFTTPYRYTRLGKIRNAGSLKAAVGTGGVQVKFAAQ
ncbi:hypothetical protein EGS38_11125 [Neisseria chenwenguii]|nr:hypothetical protein EGS38_11125 [Neisseria chenwenguii]